MDSNNPENFVESAETPEELAAKQREEEENKKKEEESRAEQVEEDEGDEVVQLENLRVVDLRFALRSRGIPTTGLKKAQLVEKLKSAIEEEQNATGEEDPEVEAVEKEINLLKKKKESLLQKGRSAPSPANTEDAKKEINKNIQEKLRNLYS